MAWRKLQDETVHWKVHFGSRDLIDCIEVELAEREPLSVFTQEDKDEPVLLEANDYGMVMTSRTVWPVEAGPGLVVDVPCQDWEEVLSDLQLAAVRTVNDVDYYKINRRFYCLCLMSNERAELIANMQSVREAAVAKGTEDDKRFEEGIRAANEAAGREVVVSARVEARKAPKGQN